MGHVDDDVQIDRAILAALDGGAADIHAVGRAVPLHAMRNIRRRVAAMERQGLVEIKGRGRISRAAMKAPEVEP